MSETDNRTSRNGQVAEPTAFERLSDDADLEVPRIGWSIRPEEVASPVAAHGYAVSGVGWVDEEESPAQARALRRAHHAPAMVLPMPAVLLMPDWQELVGWSGANGSGPGESLEPEGLQAPRGVYGDDPDDEDDLEDTVETVARGENVDKTVEEAVPRPAAPMPVGQSAVASGKSDADDWPDDDDETLEELAEWLEDDA